ncbi:MAG: hypothetical protein L6R43_11660 [Planctomycetes bacterium]|nr:hypothetical protein [Planctomycetota bacterium]
MAEENRGPAAMEEAVRDLLRWFRSARVPGIFLVLLEEARWGTFLEAGAGFGIGPRIGNPLEFAARSRVLLLVHGPTGIPLDGSLGLLPFERAAVKRRVRRRFGSVTVPLPRPEDLLVMKAVAGRPRDLADIASLVASTPGLGVGEARRAVTSFAGAMEEPGLLVDFDEAVRRGRAG